MDLVPICAFESSDIRLATDDPFGRVLADSSICIQGYVADILQAGLEISDDDLDNGSAYSQLSGASGSSLIILGLYRYAYKDDENGRLGSALVTGLLLQPRDHGSECVRVGVINEVPAAQFYAVACEGSFTIV
jgi:hypothetical protein